MTKSVLRIPNGVEKSAIHDERPSSYRFNQYPLTVLSNHGRWRVHAQADDIPWSKEAMTGKVRGWDGYLYEPCWINTKDAEARGIKFGDIVQGLQRTRQASYAALWPTNVLCRVRSPSIMVPVSISIIPGQLDRGGAINLITPGGLTSRYAAGQATTAFLVEVERVSMEQMDEWRRLYPEAFERQYDNASGLHFNGWIEEDK